MSEEAQNAACPHCGSTSATPVKYTWWGGMLGPKMFNHVKCNDCGKTYNSKTGKTNTVPIIIYSVVLLIIACLLFYAISNMF